MSRCESHTHSPVFYVRCLCGGRVEFSRLFCGWSLLLSDSLTNTICLHNVKTFSHPVVLKTIAFLSFSSIIPLVPPFLPLQEVKWWHLLQAVITVWFQYSKWAISPTASGRCSLPCPININIHTHRGESSLICMEREIVQVRSCGREGLMNIWRYLIILTLLCVRCCCICIFAALSPSGLFTVAWWWQTASAHVHLRHCHFWLSHEDDVMWRGVRHRCFSTPFCTCILLSVS